MAVIDLSPTASRMLARASVRASQTYGPAAEAVGGLYPLSMAAYEVDPYRMMSGWPVSVPKLDISAVTDVSATGEVIAYREAANAVTMNSIARWIADDDNFHTDTLSWYPSVAGVSANWVTSVGYSPTLFDDYEYRRGAEKFIETAINFDADSQQHMWADLDQIIGGGHGYTVLMAVNLHSVYGDSDHPFVGLWAPGQPTPNADTFTETFASYVEVTLRGETLYVASDKASPTKSVAVSDLLALSSPCYLAFCFGRPTTRIYAGNGSRSLRSSSVFVGTNSVPLSGHVALGRSNGTRLNTADMGVLDLNVYGAQLSAHEVTDEIAKLCSIYGGDQ